MAIGVDGQTCGGQVEGGVNADGPQTVAGLDVGAVAAAELIGLASQSGGVVGLDGVCQIGQVQLLRGLLHAVVVHSLALLEHGNVTVEAVGLAVAQLDGRGLVEHIVEGIAVVFIQLCFGHGVVVIGDDVADVVALDVDHDAGGRLVDEGQLELALVAGQEGRQSAVFALHIAAGVDTHLDALAGHAGSAVEEEVGVVGAVLLQHFGVLGKAAGGKADRLAAQGIACAVLALGVEAHNTAALVLDQVGDAGGVDDLALLVLLHALCHEHHGVACATLVAAGCQIRGGSAVLGSAFVVAHGVEADADACHPVHQIAGDGVLLGHVGHFTVEELGAVVLLHGLPEVHHALQRAHGRAAEAAVHIVVVLQLGACGGNAAVGHGHGAAGDIALLHQNDAVAGLQQAAGAGQAGGAGTHDDDISLFLDDLVGSSDGDLLGEVVHVITGQLDGLLHSCLDSHGGDGGAAQVGHVDALVLDDSGRDAGAGIVADADGLLVRQHLTGSDLAVKEGSGNVHPAFVTHRLGDVLAVYRGGGLGHSGGGSRGSCGGSGSTGGAGSGVAAGGQQTGSSCAHGAHSGTAHKIATRDLSHKVRLSFSFLFFFAFFLFLRAF